MSSNLISSNSEFIRELGEVLNRHNVDAQTNTPDYLLAEFLSLALDNYQQLHDATRRWHGVRYPMEHRQLHVQEPVDIEDIDAQTRREINSMRASREALPGLPEDDRLASVCQIPDCGCTGRAHP